MYYEREASPILKQLVDCYWVHDDSAIKRLVEHSVYPDGCFDIVINLDKNYKKNEILLTGIWDKKIEVTTGKNKISIGVRFYPAALSVFFKYKINDLVNKVTLLTENMLNNEGKVNFNSLYTIFQIDEVIDYLDYFLVFLYLHRLNKNNIFNEVANINNYNLKISTVAKEVGISRRHLNRLYNQNFGISTKTYMSILRFITVKEKLILFDKSKDKLLDLALECGYYDQAHFNKEFKKFSGKTPLEFINDRYLQ